MNEADTTEALSPAAAPAELPDPLPDTLGRVRLRTLIRIRWAAIAGQLAALFLVRFGLNWPLPMDAALAVVSRRMRVAQTVPE